MNSVISWLQNLLIRVVTTALIIGIALLLNVAFGYGNPLEAKADNLLTIDTSSYQVERNAAAHPERDLIGKTQAQLKDKADNIRENFHLDEPQPEGTKNFFSEVKDKAEEIVDDAQHPFSDRDRVNVNQ